MILNEKVHIENYNLHWRYDFNDEIKILKNKPHLKTLTFEHIRGVDKPYKNSPRHKIQHRPTSSRHEKRRPPGVTPNTLPSVSNLRP